MRCLFVILAALFLRAQSELTPDLDALSKIRSRMLFNLRHQPNYTCVETIERSSRPKSTARFKVVDTLRLEVALVDGREMFAWPGSRKFDDFDVTKMVTSGAIGNGNFATHARALFETRSATFHYVGVVDFEKRKAIRFDYDVPQMLSGYRIRASDASAIVGVSRLVLCQSRNTRYGAHERYRRRHSRRADCSIRPKIKSNTPSRASAKAIFCCPRKATSPW